MHIIGGKYKGKKLFTSLKNNSHFYRPTKNIVRQALANIIIHNFNQKLNSSSLELANLNCIDICCGSGSCGLEILSRGFSFITFIDKSPQACKIVQKNVDNLQVENKHFQIIQDYYCNNNSKSYNQSKHIEFLQNQLKKNIYHLVYIDPPYEQASEIFMFYMNMIFDLLDTDALIIAEVSFDTVLPTLSQYQVIQERKYGYTKLYIYSKI